MACGESEVPTVGGNGYIGVLARAINRGIRLKAQELEPDVIYLNASAKSDVLVASAALNQRARP